MASSTTNRRSNGEGSVSRRKDGRWQAALQIEGRRKAVYGATRGEAVAKLAELRRQAVRAGGLPDDANRTVNELLDAWLDAATPNLKPATIAQYTLECDKHIRTSLGGLRITKVTPHRLQLLYTTLRRSGRERTAELVHVLLRQAFSLAVRWRWLPENPCNRVVRPTHRAVRKEMWSPEQVCAFLDGTAAHWLSPLWALALFSGCRLGELLALTWADVTEDRTSISVTKTLQRVNGEWIVDTPKSHAGHRHIALPPEATVALNRQWLQQAQWRLAAGPVWQSGNLVFSAEQGTPIHRATVAHAMARECDKLGLPRLTPHGLRHMHASLLLAQGLPIPAVSERLGHAHPGITLEVYSHAIGRHDTLAAEAIGRAVSRGA